jgi:hypothetical protein
MSDFGVCEGDTCFRNGCCGTIEVHPVEGCSCHISAPCSACTSPRNFCRVCSWQERDEDDTINDHSVKYSDRTQGIIQSWKPRPLDPRKIDYRTLSHTNSSQICEGVYPEGTTREEVLARVIGTFGGRFEYFKDGKFRYIAYTD